MKVVCAPNALKGTLSAADAARAIAEGVRSAFPDAEIVELPIADGGDGTRAILVQALGGTEVHAEASDPLGRPLSAIYGIVDGGRTAVLDVASASGLTLLEPSERDPLRTTSFGTGELLSHALARGCRRIILGVGGSATVDAGIGLLSALGARFLDARGNPAPPGGARLLELAVLDVTGLSRAALDAEITVACDVENPLVGRNGAARVFAPQKGADARAVEVLEAGLERVAALLEGLSGREVRDRTFGGAAGGIAASLEAVLNAKLVSGIDLVLDRVGFDMRVSDADLVITAEGRMDAGSLRNKGPVGVGRRALRLGVPTLALVGSVDPNLDLGVAPFARVIAMGPADAADAMLSDVRQRLKNVAKSAMNSWPGRL